MKQEWWNVHNWRFTQQGAVWKNTPSSYGSCCPLIAIEIEIKLLGPEVTLRLSELSARWHLQPVRWTNSLNRPWGEGLKFVALTIGHSTALINVTLSPAWDGLDRIGLRKHDRVETLKSGSCSSFREEPLDMHDLLEYCGHEEGWLSGLLWAVIARYRRVADGPPDHSQVRRYSEAQEVRGYESDTSRFEPRVRTFHSPTYFLLASLLSLPFFLCSFVREKQK